MLKRVDITPSPRIIGDCTAPHSTSGGVGGKFFQNGRELSLVDVPPELRPYHLAPTPEKTRRIHNALCEIRRRFRAREGSLAECLGGGDRPEFWHARQLLMSLAVSARFLEWAMRSEVRADVYRLLDRAIRQTGTRRGGWLVTLSGGAP